MVIQALAAQTKDGQGNGHANGHALPQIEQLLFALGSPDSDSLAYRSVEARIPYPDINRLLQPRRTFENLKQLGNNIVRHGLRSRLQVAMFTSETAVRQYLLVLNHLWSGKHRFEDLICGEWKGKKAWFVLISGERRWLAHAYIWKNGCEKCVRQHGSELEGMCFKRHFSSQKIKVILCIDIPPIEALNLQFSENIHMPVPPDEEAVAYQRFYALSRVANPHLTLADFADEVGRGEDAIRNALRFCALPESFRDAVRMKEIRYGTAVELARLHETGATEEELQSWMKRTIFERWKVEELREKITQFLKNRNSGQISLLEIMTKEQTEATHRLQMRKVVARQLIMAVWTWMRYLDVVSSYLGDGKLGRDESPFSVRSPVRVFRALVERLEKLLPVLQAYLPEQASKNCSRVLSQARELLPVLEAQSVQEGTPKDLDLLSLPEFSLSHPV